MCAILILQNLFGVNVEMEWKELFEVSNKIVVYNNGVEKVIGAQDTLFETILKAMNMVNEGGHEMPALGVALDNEVRESLKTGLWIEFWYAETVEHNQMPFDRLLVEVVPDYMGYNLIRHFDGEYGGRCFYMSLDGDMTRLFESIQNI